MGASGSKMNRIKAPTAPTVESYTDKPGYKIALRRIQQMGSDGVLNISDLKLTVCPPLPPTVKSLLCDYNKLTILPELPPSLEVLVCHANNLKELPNLPDTLKELSCGHNPLVHLPSLPASLTELYVSDAKVETLPDLPEGLQILGCSHNRLSSLPNLPSTLTYLNCIANNLTSLPELPMSLKTLICHNNAITKLPALSNSLENLNCDNNQLTILPKLPKTLKKLACVPNPFIEPFATYVKGSDLNTIRNSINTYYESKEKGRNVSAMKQTLGRQGELPNNMISVIGSMLSGEKGTTNMQLATLKSKVGGTRRRKSRKGKSRRH